MNKIFVLTISLFAAASLYADNTTVYETQGAQGEPSFSGQAEPNQPETAVNIDAPAPATSDANAPSAEQTLQQQSSQLSQQLNQQNQKLYELQQQLSEAGAALDSAKKSLEKAHTAQEQGKTTVGGDEFLDTDLIRHLQQNVAEAQANYQQALDAYNNYRNNPNQVPN